MRDCRIAFEIDKGAVLLHEERDLGVFKGRKEQFVYFRFVTFEIVENLRGSKR